MLEALLASRAFAPVRVLVTQDFHATVQGLQTQDVATLNDAQRVRLRGAMQAAYLDGEQDGPRSFAAIAWAVKGIAPG